MEEDNSISDLMGRLSIRYPDRCFYEKLFNHNVDLDFIQAYLKEASGPTDTSILKVNNTWSLKDTCENFRSDMGQIQFLMAGIPTTELYSAIKYGFPKLASPDAAFGEKGYYFTNCSTKAANQCVLKNWTHEHSYQSRHKAGNQHAPRNWKCERGADRGTHKPANGSTLYIMFSEVALGRIKRTNSYDKGGISKYDRCDSIIFDGLYMNEGDQVVKRVTEDSSYDVIIPRGSFVRNPKVQKVSLADENFFYYDEIYVEDIAQINPCMLAEVQYFSN